MSYLNKKQSGKRRGGDSYLRDVTVTSKFAGRKRKKKTEEKPDRSVSDSNKSSVGPDLPDHQVDIHTLGPQ